MLKRLSCNYRFYQSCQWQPGMDDNDVLKPGNRSHAQTIMNRYTELLAVGYKGNMVCKI